ncbi:MAG: phosphate signaling complex protein PhoU [Planctomycetes bacterium]|nr:phosphate signaling complex protein PhoU [Planctomycetota bacterium]MBI3835745.1 phosphate signaling complex protein PhoU [Planctomycetota bacterium]
MTAHFVDLLNELKGRSLRMATLVEDILQDACDALFHTDHVLAQQVVERDRDVDAEEVEVEAEVIRLLALYQPVGSDLRILCTLLKINNDLERIADCAVNIGERARHLDLRKLAGRFLDLRKMAPLVQRILHDAMQAFGSQAIDEAEKVFSAEHAVDALYGQTVRQIVEEGSKNAEEMPSLVDILSVAKNLERIADHATNIAEDVVYVQTGEIVRHRLARM